MAKSRFDENNLKIQFLEALSSPEPDKSQPKELLNPKPYFLNNNQFTRLNTFLPENSEDNSNKDNESQNEEKSKIAKICIEMQAVILRDMLPELLPENALIEFYESCDVKNQNLTHLPSDEGSTDNEYSDSDLSNASSIKVEPKPCFPSFYLLYGAYLDAIAQVNSESGLIEEQKQQHQQEDMLTKFKGNADGLDPGSISVPDLELIFSIFISLAPPHSQFFDDRTVTKVQREYVIQKIKSGEILISSNAIEYLKSQNKLKQDTNWKNVVVPTTSLKGWWNSYDKKDEYWSFLSFSAIWRGFCKRLRSLPFMGTQEKEVEDSSNQSPRGP